MARVLVAWELGGGGGHVQKLRPLAARLRDDGHLVSVAARDLTVAARVFGDDAFTLLPAPFFEPRTTLPPAASYAEVLMRVGYLDAARVAALVAGWVNLLRLTGSEVLLVDHAPTALLAARIVGARSLVAGTGFTLPPSVSPMPPLALSPAPAAERVAASEARVLAVVNDVLRARDAAPLAFLGELFAASRGFLCTHPPLDHHGSRGGERYWGAVVREGGPPPPDWPGGDGEPVFAYLHAATPHFRDRLEQLAGLGRPVLAVAPGLDRGTRARLGSATLTVTGEAVDLEAVFRRCRVAVTHGGHGVVATALEHGVVPVIAPVWIEQAALASRLRLQRLAVVADARAQHHDVASAVDRALSDHTLRRKVAAFAEACPSAGRPARLAALLDAVSASAAG